MTRGRLLLRSENILFLGSVVLAGAHEKIARKTYIRARGFDSPVFDQTLAKMKTMPGWKTYEVPSGHDVMVDMPDRLVEILLEVA